MGETLQSFNSLFKVTAANGHRGLSILVSILCTVISVFTIPPMIAWLIPSSQQINIDVGKLLLNAVLTILMPMVVSYALYPEILYKKYRVSQKKWSSRFKFEFQKTCDSKTSIYLCSFESLIIQLSNGGSFVKCERLTGELCNVCLSDRNWKIRKWR